MNGIEQCDHQARNVELYCVSSEKFDKVYALEVGIHAAIGSHCSESLNSVPLDFILKDMGKNNIYSWHERLYEVYS